MYIKGYKAFNEGLKTQYSQLSIGKLYFVRGPILFRKNGYHLCKNMEDTIRYVDGINKKIDICEVTGYGDYDTYEDEYYGYYDMYCCRGLLINRILSYNEIIELAKNMSEYSLIRFIQGYKINKEDLNYFKSIDDYGRITQNIEYYQENNKEAFRR